MNYEAKHCAPSRLGADGPTAPTAETSSASASASAGASASVIPRALCPTHVSSPAATTPTSKAPPPTASSVSTSIAIIDTAGAKSLKIPLLLLAPPLPATWPGPIGVVAVFALAGDVVEEGAGFVVGTSSGGGDGTGLASFAAGARTVRGAVRGGSFAGGGDGRTAGDGFFDEVLLVELCVRGVEVVVCGWDFDFLRLFVMTAAAVAATSYGSVASSESAGPRLSGVADMVVRPHFIDLLCQMIHTICRLSLLTRGGR